jgi:hypothetical protein
MTGPFSDATVSRPVSCDGDGQPEWTAGIVSKTSWLGAHAITRGLCLSQTLEAD